MGSKNMRPQKGLNSNRNHHDNLSYSGKGRVRYDAYEKPPVINNFMGIGNQRPYGEGKHSRGGKPKQNHWP